MLRDNLVDCLCTSQFEVEEHIFVAWIEFQGALKPKNTVSNIIETIVSTTQVIEDLCIGILFGQLAIKINGLFIITLYISAIGQSLRFYGSRS